MFAAEHIHKHNRSIRLMQKLYPRLFTFLPFIFSVIFGCTVTFFRVSPFALCLPFACFTKDKKGILYLVGSALGFLLCGNGLWSFLGFSFAVFLFLLYILLFYASPPPVNVRSFLGGLCALTGNLTAEAAFGLSFSGWINSIVSAVLCALCTYCVARGTAVLRMPRHSLCGKEQAFVLSTVCIFLLGLSCLLSYQYFSFCIFLTVVFSLCAVDMLSVSENALCSLLFGAIAYFPAGHAGFGAVFGALCAFCGYITANRYIAAALYALLGNLLCYYTHAPLFPDHVSITSGALFILLLPNKAYTFLKKELIPPPAPPQEAIVPFYDDKIRNLRELSFIFSGYPKSDSAASPEELALGVTSVICSSCNKKLYCAKKPAGERVVAQLKQQMRAGQAICVSHIGDCPQKEQLAAAFGCARMLFRMQKTAESRLHDSRELCALWAQEMSTVLKSETPEKPMPVAMPEQKKHLNKLLLKNKMSVRDILFFSHRENFPLVCVQGDTCAGMRTCTTDLPQLISKVFGTDYERIGPSDCRRCINWYRPRAAHTPRVHLHAIAATEDACGDSTLSFTMPDGNFLALLSDGCGTGREAAKKSRHLVDIAGRLILSGFSLTSAIRMVNAVAGCEKNAFSTLDVIMITPESGRLLWYKAGAAAGFIRRKNGQVDIVGSSALPVGVTSDCFEQWELILHHGDMLFCVSDGLADSFPEIEDKENFIATAISDGPSSPEAALRCLLSMVYSRAVHPKDDVTIMVIYFPFE